MLKLYGIDFSPRSNKVKMVLNALAVPFEFIEVDMLKGAHKKPDYLKLHPGGKIPVIDDNGFVLFESVAICKYLARKQNSSLYPAELKAQAVVDQWCDYASQHLDVQVVRVAFNVFVAPKINEPVSEKSIELGKAMIIKLLPVFDQALSRHDYLAGDHLTLADINLLATIDPFTMLQLDIAAFSHLQKWQKKLKSEAFYRNTKTSFNLVP